MNKDNPETPTEAREVLRQVLHQCPHQDDCDPDCHLCAYKRLPQQQRNAWIDGISDEEVLRFCNRHNRCYWGKFGDR